MAEIKHIGRYFVLGKQGRDVAKISESELLECMKMLKAELEDGAPKTIYWGDVIEYLQTMREFSNPTVKEKNHD